MGDGGLFGNWATDAADLPCLDLLPTQPDDVTVVLPEGDRRRVWHQVGNDRITAISHAGGWTTLYSAEAGLVRLNGIDPGRREELGGIWAVNDGKGRELLSPFGADIDVQARWGAGYAEWKATSPELELHRRVWAPFGDVPGIRVDVEITAKEEAGLPDAEYIETWGFKPYPLLLGGLMSRRVPAPRDYSRWLKLVWHAMFTASSLSRALTESYRRLFASRLALEVELDSEKCIVFLSPKRTGKRSSPPSRPSVLVRIPGSVFLAPLPGVSARPEIGSHAGCRSVSLRVPLTKGEGSTTASFVIGVAAPEEAPRLIEKLRSAGPEKNAESWRRVARFEIPAEPALAREATWHSYYLKSSKVRDSYFGCSYVPQASAYGFVHGVQGAPRDYAISSVPLTYLDPAGAKDLLRLIMRMTRSDGAIYYAHHGQGACTSGVIHKTPTDLPLFFLWAITEYIWATGDFAFLDEQVPFYDGHKGAKSDSTVRERALLAWDYTREGVGRGEHGMLRVGSGDWSDPIAMMVSHSRAFHKDGESAFNTALAVYALPRAAELVAGSHPREAAAMRDFARDLKSVMEDAWRGRWFLRGWDGRGNPIGDDHLFLDAQAWALIAGVGSDEQRSTLVRTIAELCDDPSLIGATILDRPHRIRHGMLAPGWDCNGGVWAAINGLLAWAYALHDPELAWRSLQKQSLAAHAAAYPHVWYGIWSGPDAYNAHYAERPGETFVHPATPMTEFPVMNSNAHAGPLLALIKVLGIEATPEGISVTPRLPEGFGPWRLSTTMLDAECDGRSIKVSRPAGHRRIGQ